jgi:hypothetical protein
MLRLAKGVIDPVLVHSVKLNSILQEIKTNLNINFPNFHLIAETASFYYNLNNNVAVRHNQSIFIFLQLPISSWPANFDLFEIQAFEIPVTQTNHTTMLTDLPKFILISKNKKRILEFHELPDVKFGMLNVEQNTIKRADRSCIMAVFNDWAQQIKELCNPSLFKDIAQPNLIRLSQNLILLINVQEYQVTRRNQSQENRQGCEFCTVQINCAVEIMTYNIILPDVFAGCVLGNHSLIREKQHATNFHILSAMFDIKVPQSPNLIYPVGKHM